MRYPDVSRDQVAAGRDPQVEKGIELAKEALKIGNQPVKPKFPSKIFGK